MSFCCEPYLNPGITFYETPKESIESYAKLHAEIMAESIRFSLLGRYAAEEDRKFTYECAKCRWFRLNNWGGGNVLIHHICLAMYPSPCQCKCIYCSIPQDLRSRQFTIETTENYEKIFSIIDYAQKNGMTAKQLESFIRSSGYLLAMLRKNKFTTSFSDWVLQDETEKISAFANELLKSGEV